ncbi:MAG: PrsW family intramembrane metalloprotease [Lachnospiraceae bacterium]|nr:PrsW family intramembrane metalloprotease [Lachnospiraceae bacterium]
MSTSLLALAILPVIVLIYYVYQADKVEKEPMGLLIKLVILGACTCLSALILEILFGAVLDALVSPASELYILLENFLVVAVSEEIGKYFVLKKVTWNNKEFNYCFDAIVYAICVGLGFALLENILYVSDGGFSVAISRALLAIPGHAVDAVFMGYFYGLAKKAAYLGRFDRAERNRHLALWVPVLIHGFYDYCLSTSYDLAIVLFFIFIVVMDIFAIRRIKASSREDSQVA